MPAWSLDFFVKIAPLISGVAFLLAAIAAWVTVFLVNRRTANKDWVDGFRDIYREFWKDPDMAKVRLWIVSESEYCKIETILRKRLPLPLLCNGRPDGSALNTLDATENDVLELIDRFCSVMAQFEYFYHLPASRKHRKRWRTLYNRSWLYRLEQREALRHYVQAFWPHFGV